MKIHIAVSTGKSNKIKGKNFENGNQIIGYQYWEAVICKSTDTKQTNRLPFIARLAMAPEATLRIVVFCDVRKSNSKASKPPSSTIFS